MNLLIGICAAIGLFASAPDPTRLLTSAEREITELARLSYASLGPAVYKDYSSIERSDNRRVEHALRLANVAWKGSPPLFYEPVFCNTSHNRNSLSAGMTIGELDRVLSSPWQTKTVCLSEGDESLDKKIADGVGNIPDNSLLSSIDLTLMNSSIAPQREHACIDTYAIHNDQFLLNLRFINNGNVPPSTKSIYLNAEETNPSEKAPVIEWVEPTGAILSKNWEQKHDILPSTKALGPEILDMQPSQALAELKKREEAAKNKLSVAGFEIERRPALWIAPIVTLLVLLYLIGHFRDLRRSVSSRKEGIWIGISPDTFSASLILLFLAFAPVGANGALVLRYEWTQETRVKSAEELCIAVLILSVWALVELICLRNQFLKCPTEVNNTCG